MNTKTKKGNRLKRKHQTQSKTAERPLKLLRSPEHKQVAEKVDNSWEQVEVVGGTLSKPFNEEVTQSLPLFPLAVVGLVTNYLRKAIYGSRQCNQKNFWTGVISRTLHTTSASEYLVPWEAYLVGPKDVWMIRRGKELSLHVMVVCPDVTSKVYTTHDAELERFRSGIRRTTMFVNQTDAESLSQLCQELKLVCIPTNVTQGLRMSRDTFEKVWPVNMNQPLPAKENVQLKFKEHAQLVSGFYWNLSSLLDFE